MNNVVDIHKKKYYKQDIIKLYEYPEENIKKNFNNCRYYDTYTFDFTNIKSKELKNELKQYIEKVVKILDISNKHNRLSKLVPINHLIEYLNYKDIDSFKVITTKDIKSYYDFLVENNLDDSYFNRNGRNKKIMNIVLNFVLSKVAFKDQVKYDRWKMKNIKDFDSTNFSLVDFFYLSKSLKQLFKNYVQYEIEITCSEDRFFSEVIAPIRNLIAFCIENSFQEFDDIKIESYKQYLEKNNIQTVVKRFSEDDYDKVSKNIRIINHIIIYIDQVNYFNFYDRDFWDLKQLKIEKIRLNITNEIYSISFFDIKSDINKKYLKSYMKKMLENTSLSISTVKQYFISLKKLINKFEEDVCKVRRDDLLEYIQNEISVNSSYYNRMHYYIDFFCFLYEEKYIKEPLLFKSDNIQKEVKHVNRTVEDYVVNQIFNVLDKFPEDLMIIYLILYCTGVRISEAISIKSNSLYYTSEGYFLRTESIKMSKEQESIIPKNLYILINKYIKEHCKLNSIEYVFKSPVNKCKPCSYNNIRKRLKNEMSKYNIKYSNGDKYRIDIHGYRHRIGTNLYEENISPYIIQKVLHHKSLEMTMAYIDLFDKDIKNSYTNFFNIKGDKLIPDESSERIVLDYLNKAFNSQALPNGICMLPKKLKKCEHANACLTCGYFGTSKDYIDILKKQLIDTEYIIEKSKQNGWTMQLATNEEVKNNLLSIINKLEKEITHC